MTKGIDRLLRRSPVQPLFRWMASDRLTVLAYHGIADQSNFDWQIRWLTQRAHPVSCADVVRSLDNGGGLPRRAVLVTFDDGDRSVYDLALPVLARYGVPGVVFAVPSLVDTDEPFWWQEVEHLLSSMSAGSNTDPSMAIWRLKRMPDCERLAFIDALRMRTPTLRFRTPQLRSSELRELEAAGVEIGNHTLTHPCLVRCPIRKVEEEIVRAHELLTEILGHEPRAFAYPNGDADSAAPPILESLGYRMAFVFDHRIGGFPPDDPYMMSRLRVNSTTPRDRFEIVTSGLHSALHYLRGIG